MTVLEALVGRLKGHAAVSAELGDRIYADWIDRRNPYWPAATVQLDSDEPDYHAGGVDGVRRASLTVTAWARTRAEATAAGDAIEARLSGSRGSWLGLAVLGCFTQSRDVQSEEATNHDLEFAGREITAEVIYRPN